MMQELDVASLKVDKIIIYCDNLGAQALMKDPVHHSRTKHIDIKSFGTRKI